MTNFPRQIVSIFRILVCALCLVCSGPAAFAQNPACQIGVISIAGDLFLIHKYGVFRFLDKHAHVGVVGWDLDELIVSRVRAAAPGRTVRRVPLSGQDLADSRWRYPNPYQMDTALKVFAQDVGSRVPCARYVLVHRYGTISNEFGIGISNYQDGRRVYLFAMMYIRVYDGRTFELIKEGPAYNDNESRLERALHNPVGGPYRQLDAAAFPDKPSDVSGNSMLRDGVRALLTSSLDMTLPEMLK